MKNYPKLSPIPFAIYCSKRVWIYMRRFVDLWTKKVTLPMQEQSNSNGSSSWSLCIIKPTKRNICQVKTLLHDCLYIISVPTIVYFSSMDNFRSLDELIQAMKALISMCRCFCLSEPLQGSDKPKHLHMPFFFFVLWVFTFNTLF